MKSTPPRWATRLLQWYCDDSLLEEVEGDLYELFHRRVGSHGLRQARLFYAWDVVRSLPLSWLKRKSLASTPTLPLDMLRNYLTGAWRSLVRQKAYSLLNLFGLASGLVISLLIFLWVQDERSYDRFHQHANRLYRLTTQVSGMEGRHYQRQDGTGSRLSASWCQGSCPFEADHGTGPHRQPQV